MIKYFIYFIIIFFSSLSKAYTAWFNAQSPTLIVQSYNSGGSYCRNDDLGSNSFTLNSVKVVSSGLELSVTTTCWIAKDKTYLTQTKYPFIPHNGPCVEATPEPEPTADPCKPFAGQSAGDQLYVVPGVVDTCPTVQTKTCAKVEQKENLKKWEQNPVKYSCSDKCQIIWDNDVQPDGSYEAFVSNRQKGSIYMRMKSLYTGKSCTPSLEADLPAPMNDKSQPDPPKPPKSQNDCPSGTTFGTVQNRPMCVKNAPPIDPVTNQPIPSIDDGKACIADCDQWKPDVKGNDTSNGKTGTGTGVDGDGQQDPSKNGGGTPNGKVDAKDEEGNDVSGENPGFSEIKQDDIYKSKYKEKSFGSIWTDKKELLLNTGFIKGISDSFPKVANGGTAPKLTIDFSVFRMGSASYEIPPYVILFVKACLILTACLTARKIIWG
jgi:hypothetical protein